MFVESVIVSWMVYMASSRNVDHSVCSDDVADLASRFSHFLLPVDVTVCGKFDPMRMFLQFEGFLYAQIGVTSNGCLEDINLL